MEIELFLWTSTSAICTKPWLGKAENVINAQEAFSHRAKMNKLAAQGLWSHDLEN